MKNSTILSLIICAVIPLTAAAHGPQPNEEYQKCVYVDSNNTQLPYRMLKPENIKDGDKYPLVVFLHGSGERGDDNEKQLTYGASVFSNPANADKFPAFVIFPQCKEKAWTDKISPEMFMPGSSTPPESKSEEAVMELIANVIENNPIDQNRIYIVGISMGGIAAYDLVCRYPSVFTAAIPICGAVNPDRLSDAKDVKFLIFHGEDDDEVPSFCSREAYKALSAAGADVDYIEFAGIGHECWSSAFNYPTLLSWLFSKSKDNPMQPHEDTLTYLEQ